jgi:hypothetical protein
MKMTKHLLLIACLNAQTVLAAAVSLEAMSSRDRRTSAPSTFHDVRSETRAEGASQVFRFEDVEETIDIRMIPGIDPAGGIGFEVLDSRMPAGKAILTLQPGPMKPDGKSMARAAMLVDVSRRDDAAAAWDMVFRETAAAEHTSRLTVRARPAGKSVEVTLEAPAMHFSGVATAWDGEAAESVREIYQLCDVRWLPDTQRYGSCFADVWGSNASLVGIFGFTIKRPLTDGKRNPLRETFYITFSRHYGETLPNPPHAPSPYLDELASRVLFYTADRRPFTAIIPFFEAVRDLGVDRLAIVFHIWQRYGFDQKFPTHVPARPGQGGDEALRRLAGTVMGMGHRFALHQNLYDFYPDSPDYRKPDRALESDGMPVGGWDWGAVHAHFLKPSKLLDYAKRLSPELRERYGCNAAFYDIMPTHRVDYDAEAPGAGVIRYTHEQDGRLAAFARELYGGPCFFEAVSEGGVRASMLAGLYDGGMANGMQLRNRPLACVSELLKIHPKMANHGMSYYERWALWGRGPGCGTYVPTTREMDDYRAMTVAFGRVGAILFQLQPDHHAVMRHYHLSQAFTHAYTGRNVVSIQYESTDGTWLDAGTALRLKQLDRMKIVYEDGQAVYVNRRDEPWTVDDTTLPVAGSYTRGPRATGGTTLYDDLIGDYAEYPGPHGRRVFADARSHAWTPSTDAVARVRAHDFRDVGDGKFELKLTFTLNRPFSKPHRVFACFKQADGQHYGMMRHITPAVPITDWEVGNPITIGPHTFHMVETHPAHQGTHYFLGVSFLGELGRIDMIGKSRDLIAGYLDVERKDKKVTGLTFRATEDNLPPMYAAERYFADTNRGRKLVEFPSVATDGAVFLQETDLGTEVVAYPDGKPTRIGLPGAWQKVELLKPDWTPAREIPIQVRDGWTWFTANGDKTRYRAARAEE